MYVVARHEIHDPDKAWEMANGWTPPEGFTLHLTVSSEGGRRAVCIWEAESPAAVQTLIDEGFGAVADTETFAVDQSYAKEAGFPSALPG
ncbi:MAG: DUF3303 family protein [Actinomycetota bacterium]